MMWFVPAAAIGMAQGGGNRQADDARDVDSFDPTDRGNVQGISPRSDVVAHCSQVDRVSAVGLRSTIRAEQLLHPRKKKSLAASSLDSEISSFTQCWLARLPPQTAGPPFSPATLEFSS